MIVIFFITIFLFSREHDTFIRRFDRELSIRSWRTGQRLSRSKINNDRHDEKFSDLKETRFVVLVITKRPITTVHHVASIKAFKKNSNDIGRGNLSGRPFEMFGQNVSTAVIVVKPDRSVRLKIWGKKNEKLIAHILFAGIR